MKLIKILNLVLASFMCLQLSAHEINLQTIKDGLVCNTISDITQDRDGYIWLATIYAYKQDHQGHTWIGTKGAGNVKTKPVKEMKPTEPTILMSTLDKKFKDKVEAIVAQHIGDNNFYVDHLAELLNLGRTSVYNRTKSIMGISPNMYIQNERLRIAAELLLQGEYTVSEVSDKVGFSDATYLYKCFKNKYGVAPSKFGK